MNRHRIGKLQLIRLRIGIVNLSSFVKFHLEHLGGGDHLDHPAQISVKDTHPPSRRDAVSADTLPLHLVVVFDLHHFIAQAKNLVSRIIFRLVLCRRIQLSLQNPVQHLYPERPPSHGSQHLNLFHSDSQEAGQLVPKQLYQMFINDLGIVSFQKKEIFALIVQRNGLTPVDPVCIHNNITFFRLPEDLLQGNRRQTSAGNQIL